MQEKQREIQVDSFISAAIKKCQLNEHDNRSLEHALDPIHLGLGKSSFAF